MASSAPDATTMELRAYMQRFKCREDVVNRDKQGKERGRVQFYDLRGLASKEGADESRAMMDKAMKVLRERKNRGEKLPRVIKVSPHNLEQLIEQSKRRYATVEDVPSATLNDGRKIPLVGLGTWQAKPGQVRDAVLTAMRKGYRHIDCAEYYANEHEIGQALSVVFAEGVVKREHVFLTSKLWNNHHAKESVRPALVKILKNLRTDYLDLLLIHWPVAGTNAGATVMPSIQETWQAMEALVREGLVRSIGLSNFSAKKIDAVLSYASIPPAVNQVEVHPYWRQEKLLAYCESKGIHVTAHSTLGSPDSSSMHGRTSPRLMDDPVVKAVAARVGRSPAQVLIRWGVQRGTSVLPKSTNGERIASNLDVTSWSLGPDDFDALSSLGHQERMIHGRYWVNPKGPYPTLEALWDDE